jgi:serine/threonine-protein kinase
MPAEKSTSRVEQIGRYRITGELGRGGMGVVYLGEDPLIGREVAVKTLTEVTPELRQRFYLEARSGILSHPNIVTIYELGEQDGNPFIAMEYISGESLENILHSQKRLPVLETLSIIEQLCAGLGYAHGRGVVHRDIKPANILVQPDGRVTIVDFGIARLSDQPLQLTKTDALLGTFHYIAPERLKGDPSDGRADLWSVGVILYEMLSGELPFKGKDVSSLYRVIHEPYIPLKQFVPDLLDGITEILDKALAKNVGDRYATAEQMALDLQLIAAALKQERINAFLDSARSLVEVRQFANARAVLLQAQRIDPSNTETNALITEVQEQLNQLQRHEQLRQVVEQGQAAQENRHWQEAINLFQQAEKLDTENLFGLKERLKQVQEQRQQQLAVAALWEQASEARNRGDLGKAQDYLGQALQINENSTDLKNAYSVILREIKRKQQSLQVEELLNNAKESYSSRKYTEAITRLREAAELDPTHTEVQQLLFTATTRQREERRQGLLEKVAAEIQDALNREDFELAQDRAKRALETLPGEALLLRLQAEADSRRKAFVTQQIVRETMLQAQNLFADQPAEALRIVERGLEKAPESATLRQSRSQLQAHLKELEANTARSNALVRAHSALEAKDFLEAKRVLEETLTVHGGNEEIERLLKEAATAQAQVERKEVELRTAAQIRSAITEAEASCEKALTQNDWERVMTPWEALEKCYGTRPEIVTFRSEWETKRRAKAEQILREAMQATRHSLQANLWKEASATLRQVDEASSYSGARLQGEYQSLRAECTARKAANSKSRSTFPAANFRKRILYVSAAVTVVAAATIGFVTTHHREPKHSSQLVIQASAPPSSIPAPARTDIEINASPWAKILRIQDSNGKALSLPEEDETTPIRFDAIDEGSYKVTLEGPDNQTQTIDCTLTADNHLCTADFGTIDIQQVLKGAKQ